MLYHHCTSQQLMNDCRGGRGLFFHAHLGRNQLCLNRHGRHEEMLEG